MRRIPVFLLGLVLSLAAPALAGSGDSSKDQPATKENKTANVPAHKSAVKKAAAAMPNNAAFASELTQMQRMIDEQARELAAQRKQIDALQHQIEANRPATASSTATIAVPARNAALAAAETAAPATTESASNAVPHAAPATTAVIRDPGAKAKSTEQGPQLPASIELAGGTIRLGFTVFGDWGWYPNTSYGPQFFTMINQPGPGNDNFNSFDINRTYINFFYTPRSGKYTLRLTPNIYRQITNAGGKNNSSNSTVGGSGNGNLTLRMKYAYLQLNHPFGSSSAFGKDIIVMGQETNPLVDWEEGFYGYRFTSLVPWNYLSLSSTHAGIKVGGPIMANGKQYLDYDVGVFDSGSFHNQEVAAEKQVMARLSVYPMGAKSKYGGLGFTAFVDFGYANKAPDQQNTTTNSLYRTAFFAHYWAPHFDLLGEYDYGKNAFSTGNLTSGSAPSSGSAYAYLCCTASSEAAGILGSNTQQRGFDFLGHVDIPGTPLALFGLYQYFQPNINVSKDPLDFERVVGGISYKYDSHLEFAVDSQNVLFTHSQFTYGSFANAVPPDINAFFINMQVNY